MTDHAHDTHDSAKPATFEVRILRQDGPGQPSYWERHEVPYEPDMNVISVLQRIAARATTADGKDVAPVAWECKMFACQHPRLYRSLLLDGDNYSEVVGEFLEILESELGKDSRFTALSEKERHILLRKMDVHSRPRLPHLCGAHQRLQPGIHHQYSDGHGNGRHRCDPGEAHERHTRRETAPMRAIRASK